ncbi:MAG: M1 family metallopeptidase, partial [Candidatus Thermoplasmatota archaeon]|nr:M1 family metallopeptidase [Candidatus Thermoplasmatota archaeon]
MKTTETNEITGVRLPASVRPEKYVLSLKPDLNEFTFQGEESVDIQVTESVSSITLNASELQVSSARVKLGEGTTLPAKGIDLDESEETVTLSFDRTLPKGPATLSMQFTGILNDQLRGFYRSQYVTPRGEKRFLAATQFAATDARLAFPCWDEPALKATFEVTLVIRHDYAAISNTHVVAETRLDDGTKAVRFAETPRMSTYLLAFVVGDLASLEATAPDGTLIRVWATRDKVQFGRFALENSIRLLNYLNDYFGIRYPLKKLDHIALPDFAAGAMENWGAITYRERALLYDPKISSAITKQRIVEVIAHEMAHMWFGDLVTMEWWDDLWLNESFASWMGNKAVAQLYPEWSMWTQFLFLDTTGGLNLDGLKNSHAIEVSVKDPAEISEIFDRISYSKGAAILWMLEQFLDEKTFQRGIHGYLSTNKYGNARTEDLWKALTIASGQPVTNLMDTWVKQTGFPLLQAKTG